MTSLNNTHLAFIGGGNMARSLIGGLINKGHPGDKISVSEPDKIRRDALVEEFGINACTDNLSASTADCLILAVKPQLLSSVAQQIASTLSTHPRLVISIAAGVRSNDLCRWLGGHCPVIRCMPNTPALVGLGACGLFANPLCNNEHKQRAEQIMQSVGVTAWTEDEHMIDNITALSGSGPAYFFLLIESMQHAAVEMGMQTEDARQLALQTALGAATMASNSNFSAAELRRQVTSPNGTTEAALKQFASDDFSGSVQRAMQAASTRATTLSEELGKA